MYNFVLAFSENLKYCVHHNFDIRRMEWKKVLINIPTCVRNSFPSSDYNVFCLSQTKTPQALEKPMVFDVDTADIAFKHSPFSKTVIISYDGYTNRSMLHSLHI